MCLNTGGSSKPALQQRTLPAEGIRPADESTASNPGLEYTKSLGKNPADNPPPVNWDDYDSTTHNSTKTSSVDTSDPGLNL